MIDPQALDMAVNKLNAQLKAEKASSNSYIVRFADNAKYNTFKSSANNLLKGRRGMGKTHMLKLLEEELDKKLNEDRKLGVFIDLREVKSSTFNNETPATESLECFRRFLLELTNKIYEKLNLDIGSNKLNRFLLPITKENRRINKLKNLKKTILKYTNDGKSWSLLDKEDETRTSKKTNSVQGKLSDKPELSPSATREDTIQNSRKLLRTFHFLDISNYIKQLLEIAKIEEFFLLIDEWSEIPLDIQPYFAECFKSTFFSIGKCHIKLAMIPYRTQLTIYDNSHNPLGLEGSGELFSIDLDDSLVLDRDKTASEKFFTELLYKQLSACLEDFKSYENRDGTIKKAFITDLFTNSQVFNTLVRASAGIPRDFLLIFIKSHFRHVGRKATRKIGVEDIMLGAKEWYNNDKVADIKENSTDEYKLLNLIAEFVFSFDKKRVYFLVHPNVYEYSYLKRLVDLRLLHRIKEMSSSKDNTSGIRYIMMSLDFGGYVELLETKQVIDFNIEKFQEEFYETNGDILDTNRGTIRKRILPESLIEQHKQLINKEQLSSVI